MHQQHNKGKVEGFMAELGRKLDFLFDRARQGAEEAKLSDRMEELKQAKDKLEHELHEFVQDDEKWKEVQKHLQGAAQELRRAFETTFKTKQNTDGHQENNAAWQQQGQPQWQSQEQNQQQSYNGQQSQGTQQQTGGQPQSWGNSTPPSEPIGY